MLHSYLGVFIHFVWSTKNREPYLIKDLRPTVVRHIIEYASAKKFSIDTINIQKEHVHMLTSLRSDQNIDDIAKLIKGESSHWINSENLTVPKFSWQRGYGAFSVSRSHIEIVRRYISNQDDHHRIKTYLEEITGLLAEYNAEKMDIGDEV
jgi:putative transposase